jgi:hypothetical protein
MRKRGWRDVRPGRHHHIDGWSRRLQHSGVSRQGRDQGSRPVAAAPSPGRVAASWPFGDDLLAGGPSAPRGPRATARRSCRPFPPSWRWGSAQPWAWPGASQASLSRATALATPSRLRRGPGGASIAPRWPRPSVHLVALLSAEVGHKHRNQSFVSPPVNGRFWEQRNQDLNDQYQAQIGRRRHRLPCCSQATAQTWLITFAASAILFSGRNRP